MSFLNNNLNKPKLNSIKKKPTIKVPKLESKVEVKDEPKITQEIEFNPSIEEKTVSLEEEISSEKTFESQQTFDEFKSLEETEENNNKEETKEIIVEKEITKESEDNEKEIESKEETEEKVVEEVEEKPKKTRKRKAKKEETKVDESEEEFTEVFNTTVIGNSDLDFIEEQLLSVVSPTTPAWEEEKVIVNQKMDEIVIDTDMGSLEMDEMLSKLSHLENDVRQRLEEIEPVFLSLQDLVEFVELTAGKGSNAAERKATGKIACTRYVKEPGAEPMNLYTYLNFQRARYQFYKSKMEQIKNENGRLITLSAVKKLEVNLSR